MSTALANRASAEVRMERTRIKRALWTGELSFADVDLDDPRLARMPLLELLEVLPVDGRVHRRTSRRTTPSPKGCEQAERILASFGAHKRVQIGALSGTRKQQLRWLVSMKVADR